MCYYYWNNPTGSSDSTVEMYKGSVGLIFWMLLYKIKIDLMKYLFADFLNKAFSVSFARCILKVYQCSD